jgi:hypothetical protein
MNSEGWRALLLGGKNGQLKPGATRRRLAGLRQSKRQGLLAIGGEGRIDSAAHSRNPKLKISPQGKA